MTWKVKRTDAFLKHLRKQKSNRNVLEELDKKIAVLKTKPQNIGSRLSGKLHGKKSTRISRKFRLIFQIEENEKVVYLIALGHRGKVY